MIECKDYGDRQVGIEEVNKFAGVVAVARNAGVIDKGLLVTTTGFTREAKGNAAVAGIELATFRELSTQLVDFSELISRTIEAYERLAASSRYIELAGTENEDYIELDRSSFVKPIDVHIARFLLEDLPGGGHRLALLGNFGTGKSTFCKKFAHDLALAYRGDPSRRIPILINLSDYDWRFDIQHLILQTLTGRYETAITNAVCQELQRQGRFLIILDGLDEMATRVDSETIEDNIREIARLSLIESNRLLLTCRTHFFRDKVELQLLSDFGILFIPEWGAEELREYLQKCFGPTWKDQLKLISSTHNLTELAQTPLFLEMIVETLPQLGDQIARTRLYQVYTDRWIIEQSKRKGARLKEEARRQFVTELAVALWMDDNQTRHYREFSELLRLKFNLEDAAHVDYLRTDIQTCTFLTRDAHGNYAFRHRSFLEFFVGCALAEAVSAGESDLLCRKPLSLEIRSFLADLVDPDLVADTLRGWIKGRDATLRENALALGSVLGIALPAELFEESGLAAGEVQIAAKLVRGDADGFNLLYAYYAPSVFRYLHSLTKDRAEAEDCMAEVFVRMWRKGSELERIGSLDRYIIRVAKSVYIDKYRYESRRAARHVDFDLERIHEWEPFEPAAEDHRAKIAAIDIDELLSKLPRSEHEIVRRYVLDRESLSTIAESLRISRGRVRRRYSDAIKKLRSLLLESSPDVSDKSEADVVSPDNPILT